MPPGTPASVAIPCRSMSRMMSSAPVKCMVVVLSWVARWFADRGGQGRVGQQKTRWPVPSGVFSTGRKAPLRRDNAENEDDDVRDRQAAGGGEVLLMIACVGHRSVSSSARG